MENFTENFGWIEVAFFGVVALGFGFYQLWSVSREIRKDNEKAKRKSASEDNRP